MAKNYTVYVPAGNTLEMVTDELSSGYYQQLANPGNAPILSVDLAAEADITIGPFNNPRNYYIHLNQGDSVITTQVASGVATAVDDALLAAKQDGLSALALTTITPDGTELVFCQDENDNDILKVVTAQSIADLVVGSTAAATLQANIDDKQDALSGASLTAATVAVDDLVLIQDLSDSDNLKTVSAQSIADLKDITGKVNIPGSPSTLGTLANDADGTAIAAAVNAINAILIAAGLAVAP